MSADTAPIEGHSATDSDVDLRGHIKGGYFFLGGLVALVLGWGFLAQIAGAVVAPGKVVLESSVKKVQHKEGGIVSELYVREGDRVKAGALLARIDSTVPQANLAVVTNQLEELTARRLRLIAERDGAKMTSVLAMNPVPQSSTFRGILGAEVRLMDERRSLRSQKKSQLLQQMAQSREQIAGLEAQVAAQVAQRQLIEGEVTGVRQLYERGLATLPRLNALEREAKRLDGAKGQLTASIAEARTQISELQFQALQIDSEELALVMGELKETEIKLAQLAEQRTTGEDELRRVELRAPAAGQVQQLAVHTRGEVIAAGETMMLLVPEQDELIVEATIEPQNIDQISPGRAAKVRFTAFALPNTPELDAKIDRLSADVQTDERTGQQYYVARIKINEPKVGIGLRSRLVAGMPAEVQIATGSRRAISYFLKPLSDQLSRTFREE